MVQIIPAINTQSIEDLKHKLALVEPYVDKVHIDIMDGRFVPNTTITVQELATIQTKLKIQVHLMADHPIDYIDKFAKLRAHEFIFHAEALGANHNVADAAKKAGLIPGIALNPETKVVSEKHLLEHVQLALLMGVHPGKSGQKFISEVLPKIKEMHNFFKDMQIGIDGGMNLQTGCAASREGIDFLAVTSALFGQPEIKKALDNLRVAVNIDK